MQKYLSLLLAAVMIFVFVPFSILPVSAEVITGECGDNLKWSFDTTTGVLSIIGDGGMGRFSSAPWYAYDSLIKSVLFSGNITSIGSSAFCNCTGLTSVTIPSSVTSIETDAFRYCTGLTSIIIPSSVTSIGIYAFDGCIGLTSINIPASVTSIGTDAFHGCTGLTSITVVNGNTVYHSTGNCLIETKSKMLVLGCKNSVIPSDGSVTSIGYPAFYECTGLTNIAIPSSVTTIGSCAFEGCTGLTSIAVPASVTTIGNYAFMGCSALDDIYCEAKSQPSGWDFFWNYGCDANVHWGSSAPMEIITGDISGDGKVNSKDYAFLKRYCLGTYKLDDSVKSAGDINKDGKVNSKDYALLKRACLGTYTIEQ